MANDPQEKAPTILVIFGATGHLTQEKLVPSIFRLYEKRLLPPRFRVVGFSRKDLKDVDFQSSVGESVRAAFPKAEKEKIKAFTHLFGYSRGHFDKKNDYYSLANILNEQDKNWHGCANKLFYLAVPPEYYKTIFQNLAKSGLTIPCGGEGGWTRVIVEKPFGKDLKTAEELDALLGKLFEEEQIYRIDHYLGKETVQNILAFRFSNSFLDPAWDKDSIESISIQLFETGGVEDRGAFYDGVGALRDVGQNHMLQLLALFTMENPHVFTADTIRSKRAEVLNSLRIMSAENVRDFTARAQYSGYTKIKNVARNSKTETYFRIKAFVNTPRWSGVPIYLESGKKLDSHKAEVAVTFKHPVPCLCPPGAGKHYKNVLRYHIQPKESITTSFWVKKPGSDMVLEEKDFVFDYEKAFGKGFFVDAYEKLLLDAFAGNQTLFVSTDEIMASWRYIDPILNAWRDRVVPLLTYRPKSRPRVVEKQTIRKEIGFVGLGKMGLNMVTRLVEHGWRVVAFDQDKNAREEAKGRGAVVARSLKEVGERLKRPRLVWVMVPAGAPVDDVIFGKGGVASFLRKNETIIDGGNSFYEDSARRAKKLHAKGIRFLDAGVSGGPGGARNGACIMVGGEEENFLEFEHLFLDLSLPDGYAYVGKHGAGHFVKMVHNGIEYGMMQALAEGFAVLKKSSYKLNLRKIADLYNHGSVIESRLVKWLKDGFEIYGEDLKDISGTVHHTGEGEWTVKTAKKLGVPAPIIKGAFDFRVKSVKRPSYIGKVLSALRNQFGGHSVK